MTGAINVKRINESMKHATNALFAEYARRMFARLAYKESGDETGCCKRGLWNWLSEGYNQIRYVDNS
ncbi:MAG: hypothetical protein II123_03635 [Lachnospiraceae bacterium]|nr:hypothetical protein [Lachnospiraceae bacterium]